MSEKIKLENLPEMATKVNAASRALGALQSEQKAGTNVVRKVLVQSVMGEILSARARGVTYKAIASALCKSMDIKIKASTLSEYIKRDVAKIDGCARKIARNVANEKDKQR